MSSIANTSFCTIPVQVPKSDTQVQALVSPEDYEMLVGFTPMWRLSGNGYVVSGKRVNGKNVLRYMHKLILNESATHINKNKLDNRRVNLQPLQTVDPEEGITIHSINPLMDFVHTSVDVPQESTYCTIRYHDDMIYRGEIHQYKPHGFGTLEERNKTSLGWWMQGNFKHGLVMYLVPIPERMRQDPIIPRVRQAVLVYEEKKIF